MSCMSVLERRFVVALIDSALAADCLISVRDENGIVLDRSKDAEAILAVLGSTEVERLILRRDGRRVGSLTLVYGNDEDVVADFSVPFDGPYVGSWLEAIVVSARTVALTSEVKA